MALPDDSLSTDRWPSTVFGARALAVTRRVDYEDGGIALNDPSRGLLYQRWRARLIGDDVIIDASEVEETVLFSGSDITEISFTFDQNMRPALAFVQNGVAKLRWFDSVIGQQVITEFPGAITPRVVLDDKRATQSAASDIIFAYVRDGALYYRQQRDRFTIERLLDQGPHKGLIKIGMGRNLRLQFVMEYGR